MFINKNNIGSRNTREEGERDKTVELSHTWKKLIDKENLHIRKNYNCKIRRHG